MSAPLPASASSDRIISLAIVCLSLAAFGSGSSLRVTDSLLPRLANDFDVSLGTASYAITAFSIAYGVAQLMFGPLGDRFGKYLVIASACGAGVFTTLLCALAPNFPLLLAARFLAGSTAAAIIPLSMAWIGDVIPYEQRQPVLARFLIGQIVGLSSGVLVGGMAADHTGWRLPFFGIALLYVFISAILFWLNSRLPAHAKRTVKSEGPVIQRMAREFGEVLSRPWARIVLATVFMEGFFLYGAFSFIASHLHHEHGMSLTAAGSMVMLFGLGGVAFAAGSGLLVRRLGELGLVKAGGALAAAALVCTGLAPAWAWAPASLWWATGAAASR